MFRFLCVLFIVFTIISCSNSKKVKQEKNIDTLLIIETSPTKEDDDSIQPIINHRKESFYQGNIFGGLKMGISESNYDRIIKQYIKEYDNRIYFEKDGIVRSFLLRRITPQFYKNQLVELEITIDGGEALRDLEPFFKEKYGDTKYSVWEWNNLDIKLTKEYKGEYKDYAGKPTGLYFDGGIKLSKVPYYTQITYRNLQILRLKEREKKRNDSIKNIEENKKRKIIEKENLRKSKNIKDVI